MKKNYSAPTMITVKIQNQALLGGSGEPDKVMNKQGNGTQLSREFSFWEDDEE